MELDIPTNTEVIVDTTTGMPVLPDRYFWRVNGYNPGEYERWPSIEVQLRKYIGKKQTRFSSNVDSLRTACENREQKLWTADGYYYYAPISGNAVTQVTFDLAASLYKQHEQRLTNQLAKAELEIAIDGLRGDYPPKKLEV